MVSSPVQETLLDPLWGEEEALVNSATAKDALPPGLQTEPQGSREGFPQQNAVQAQVASLGFSDGDDQWQPQGGEAIPEATKKPPNEPQPTDCNVTEEGLVPETMPTFPDTEATSPNIGGAEDVRRIIPLSDIQILQGMHCLPELLDACFHLLCLMGEQLELIILIVAQQAWQEGK